MRESISVAIVKPVDANCNMSCLYCYMQNIPQNQTVIMNKETLKAVIDFFCAEQEESEFIWHGGEPLLAGINFYQQVVEYQAPWLKAGKKVANFVQTNATLINEEWANFFTVNNFFVGVSLDAPLSVHNTMRYFKNGAHTFESTVRGINFLRAARIFNGVSCCVSSDNCFLADEVFDFFVSLGIKSIKFLRVKGQDVRGELYPGSITCKQYFEFLLAIFRKWIKVDDPEVEIRDIKSLVDIALGGDFRECVYMGRCDQFVTIYSDGSVYACDSLPKLPQFCFGNVQDGRQKMQRNKNFRQFIQLIKQYKDQCVDCQWFSYCNGWCLQERLQTAPEQPPCEELKWLFEEIKTTLKQFQLI